MPGFSISPATDFPSQTPDEFPNYIQFQEDGTNLGNADADTLNFGTGMTATRGVGANANVVTVAANGSGGGGTPSLVVQLTGADSGAFDDAAFSDWDGAVLNTSADAAWNPATQRIDIVTAGVYEVLIAGRITDPSGVWPTANGDWTIYGAEMLDAPGVMTRSAYARHAEGSNQDTFVAYVQFTDQFIVNATEPPLSITPAIYGRRYLGDSESALFDAMVTVRRVT